jgi:hypothetical protein
MRVFQLTELLRSITAATAVGEASRKNLVVTRLSLKADVTIVRMRSARRGEAGLLALRIGGTKSPSVRKRQFVLHVDPSGFSTAWLDHHRLGKMEAKQHGTI